MTDEQVPSILDLQYRPLTSPLPGTFVSSTDLKIIGPQGQDPYDRQVDLHFKIDHQHYHNIKFDVDTNPFQITVQGFPVGYYRIHYTYLNRDNWSDWYDSGLFTVVGKPNITGPGQNSLVQLSVDITGNGAVSQATMVVREETSGTVYGSGSALPDGTWKVVVKNLPADTAISLVAAQIYNNVEINTSAPLKLNVRATPVVISPKAGDVVRKLRPEVSGTGSNGTTVTIFHVGGVGGSYGSGTVANGLWKFKLTQDLHEGDFLIHAHATFNEQSMGWANMVPIIVRPAPVITGPEAGTVQNQTFTISGTNGEPGATIKIIEEPNDVVGTGSALSSGNWSIAVTVPPGPVSLVATQSIGIEPPPAVRRTALKSAHPN
jgi:hypothetical protein